MKKLIIATLALTVVGSSVLAQTNQVLSRNAVGYVRVEAPSNKLNMIRLDFINLAGSPYTVTNLFGNQLSQGAVVYIWDISNQVYRTESKQLRGWSPGTNAIRRGYGIFMQSFSNTQIFLMGEVPDQSTAPTTVVHGLAGLNLTGYPYPADLLFTNSPYFANAVQGDILYTWNVDSQTYNTYSRQLRGWSPADHTNLVLKPGQGFWYQRTAGNVSWTFPKPYTWP